MVTLRSDLPAVELYYERDRLKGARGGVVARWALSTQL
jgi:hypothetical protein